MIAQVVRDFPRRFAAAAIYVCDNTSRDRTMEVARSAGAGKAARVHDPDFSDKIVR